MWAVGAGLPRASKKESGHDALIMSALADSEAIKDPTLQDIELLPCKPRLYMEFWNLCLSWTMIQHNMTHVFLHCNMETYKVPQILKERAAAGGWRLWFLPQGLENCLCSCSNLDKEMRNFWF